MARLIYIKITYLLNNIALANFYIMMSKFYIEQAKKEVLKKVKKSLSIRGPKYLQLLVPCPLGWRYDSSLTIDIAKLAVETGLYPLLEYVDGNLTSVRKIVNRKPVEDYLRPQGRFSHLFGSKKGMAEIAYFQSLADQNISKYGLLQNTKVKN